MEKASLETRGPKRRRLSYPSERCLWLFLGDERGEREKQIDLRCILETEIRTH